MADNAGLVAMADQAVQILLELVRMEPRKAKQRELNEAIKIISEYADRMERPLWGG